MEAPIALNPSVPRDQNEQLSSVGYLKADAHSQSQSTSPIPGVTRGARARLNLGSEIFMFLMFKPPVGASWKKKQRNLMHIYDTVNVYQFPTTNTALDSRGRKNCTGVPEAKKSGGGPVYEVNFTSHKIYE